MRHKDLVKKFGSEAKVARAISPNFHRQTVNKWKKSGIPIDQQIEIERITNGELKADLPDFVRTA